MEDKQEQRRQTPIYIAICNFFESHIGPADYNDIAGYLSGNNISANKTTVYRQLEKMLVANKIQEFDLGEGKKRYEQKDKHHHHLICNKCHKIECFEIDKHLQAQEQDILKTNGFTVTSHMLEFFGICQKCNEEID